MFFSLSRTEEQKAELKRTNHKKFTAYFSKSFYLTVYRFEVSFCVRLKESLLLGFFFQLSLLRRIESLITSIVMLFSKFHEPQVWLQTIKYFLKSVRDL